MLYNIKKSCLKSCKKIIAFFKKHIVFQKKTLFSNMCTFLSHCFETNNYHCVEYILYWLCLMYITFVFQEIYNNAKKDLSVVVNVTKQFNQYLYYHF